MKYIFPKILRFFYLLLLLLSAELFAYNLENSENIIIASQDQIEVIGDKCAISSNPEWIKDKVLSELTKLGNFVIARNTNLEEIKTKHGPAIPVFYLKISLYGDEEENRKITLKLENNRLIKAYSQKPYKGKGLKEDVKSIELAVEEAVKELVHNLDKDRFPLKQENSPAPAEEKTGTKDPGETLDSGGSDSISGSNSWKIFKWSTVPFWGPVYLVSKMEFSGPEREEFFRRNDHFFLGYGFNTFKGSELKDTLSDRLYSHSFLLKYRHNYDYLLGGIDFSFGGADSDDLSGFDSELTFNLGVQVPFYKGDFFFIPQLELKAGQYFLLEKNNSYFANSAFTYGPQLSFNFLYLMMGLELGGNYDFNLGKIGFTAAMSIIPRKDSDLGDMNFNNKSYLNSGLYRFKHLNVHTTFAEEEERFSSGHAVGYEINFEKSIFDFGGAASLEYFNDNSFNATGANLNLFFGPYLSSRLFCPFIHGVVELDTQYKISGDNELAFSKSFGISTGTKVKFDTYYIKTGVTILYREQESYSLYLGFGRMEL